MGNFCCSEEEKLPKKVFTNGELEQRPNDYVFPYKNMPSTLPIKHQTSDDPAF